MKFNSGKIGLGMFLLCAGSFSSQGQTQLTLSDFQSPSKSWKEAAQVWADPQEATMLYSDGEGTVFYNLPDRKNPGKDLISSSEYGDVELKMEYLMAPGSNSGLYLQGQYEIQLLDSWTTTYPKAGDNGGIYQRWDESKPEAEKGYEGYAPRQNASKAPGLWQTLEVGFEAPRFSASGEKIKNAHIRYVRLNGVVVQEDVSLSGPTRGALQAKDIARGPLRIQGDHGPIAIRNLEVKAMDTPAPQINALTYEAYAGSFTELNQIEGKSPDITGEFETLADFSSGVRGNSLVKVEGTLQVEKSGIYRFDMASAQGLVRMDLADQSSGELSRNGINLEANLEKGSHPITFWVSKPRDWSTQGFRLQVSEANLWPVALSEPAGFAEWNTDPIWVDTQENPIIRSFMEMPDRGKISHGVSVSSQAGIHFSYDLSTGRLIRVWRGEFLDATPMWNNRGNGVSRPLGSQTYLDSRSKSDPIAGIADFQPKGYQVMGDGAVKFLAQAGANQISDVLMLLEDGTGIKRTITLGNSGSEVIAIAEGSQIKEIKQGLYLIEDTGLYLSLSDANMKPTVNSEGQVVLPINSTLTYTLLF
ncbi:DUF1080 domain-containing protein [Algoriphagus sp.]|uniref:3-keto-disaccharide hydrolase n=1 Tax=Algoriphagus sp. TaxID=1872435 RepID=UPI0026097923|nr:DUF1080 domain-containing protein [Algoriphagus sp.]